LSKEGKVVTKSATIRFNDSWVIAILSTCKGSWIKWQEGKYHIDGKTYAEQNEKGDT